MLDDGQRVGEALKDEGFENESLLQNFVIFDSDDARDLFTGTFNFVQKQHFYRGSLQDHHRREAEWKRSRRGRHPQHKSIRLVISSRDHEAADHR